jgi:hypothetical protein
VSLDLIGKGPVTRRSIYEQRDEEIRNQEYKVLKINIKFARLTQVEKEIQQILLILTSAIAMEKWLANYKV